ncbi:protein kinase domain-containing protein [Actinoplanes sp. CA-142083]|uniref:serine/threonine-protein kinase n=1 Tax=Actinoplanes sp. CA-142083 TaxID=3239903 RepID=UPI003D8F83EB
MPHPGEVLGDRYRLDDRIAAGGMGEVWQATDTVLGRDVAVKTLHAGRAEDPGFQTRFKHEARAMAVLHHPGVADVYDYGQSGPDAYIVMARVEGEALNQRIATRGRLTTAETMSIVAQAGRALEAAHQAGIVHRDVKPGNLIIKPDGTVVLVDFGVARSAESAALTGAKEVVGTALYIAPEQVSKETTGPSADVYALGCVAYHCLTGHPPFMGDNPIQIALHHLKEEPPPLPREVPEPVRIVVETAMAKDPAARFSSAAAMADAAELASAGAGTTAILAATGLLGAAGAGAAGAGAAGAGMAGAGVAGADGAAGGLRDGAWSGSAAVTRPGGAAGTGTAIFPATPGAPEPPWAPGPPGSPGNKRRNILLAAAALIVLGTLATVLLLANTGGNLPATTPPNATSGTNASPAAPAGNTTKKNSNREATKNGGSTTPGATATTNTGGAPAQTTKPTATQAPTETTTSTPKETSPTATTEPESTATTGTSGGDEGDSGSGGSGSDSGTGSGSGGGDQGEENAEAAATPTP